MNLFPPRPLLDMTSSGAPTRAHEMLGFELGRDHAPCGVMPSLAQAVKAASLRSGWAAGHVTNGLRPGVATRSAWKPQLDELSPKW
jgi:hypothetical protein